MPQHSPALFQAWFAVRRADTRLKTVVGTVLAAVAASLLVASPARAEVTADWQPKAPPLTTPWTDQVSDPPLPEYPRPQLARSQWQNLNGIWDFEVTPSSQVTPPSTYSEKIRVPFVAESALSGIMRAVDGGDRLWYRRTFTVPAGWKDRVKLNFDAVDYRTDVWVNGRKAGATHDGGYDAFSHDITDLLETGQNTLVVGVWDPGQAGTQAVGKQEPQPVEPQTGGGIFYTSASGIWQTVWLEPVNATHATKLDLVPDLKSSTLKVKVASTKNATSVVTVSSGGQKVVSASGAAGQQVSLKIPKPRLWTPDDPFLYDVKVELRTGQKTVDTISSYAGMRSIAVKAVDGKQRIVLNGEFLFQSGTLDQGYWPDGIYTAPTDEALKYDLQLLKDTGFNMVRKHIKVEPQRWFYHADKLGLLVWQDMPSMRPDLKPDAPAKAQWEKEFRAMIDQHRSSPSVVMWVAQNEGWGQYEQARVADLVKAYDPTRLVNNMSGINCCGAVDGGNGDIIDFHNYTGPGVARPSAERAAVVGEFGGLGLKVPGHEWFPGGGFSYEDQGTAERLNRRLIGLWTQMRTSGVAAGLSGSVYTETTDVENEVNGLATYDRQVVKVDVARLKEANEQLIAAPTSNPAPAVAKGRHSLRVVTEGFENRYVRHQQALGYTEVVTEASDDLLKNDATWNIVPGLADASCYSFEAVNYPGTYLRHQAYRVKQNANDGTPLFAADATWCAEEGEGGVKFTAWNFPGQYLRHYDAELWLATPGGNNAWDNDTSYAADTTWAVEAPWVP
ncbi:AbfB domain-containing protein [Kineosporia rhizophila]|uniref:AbfB domain-containing protein n=1 Tax=Kineosporia rhizophila TaxID=84633 RepID=UPI001E4967D1|nr:AbfB domain-containing protein [Kineosporia rhizophila]MCE0539205.1 AbfB domain-containing protein [Kineosporia rhizophila]